jgi:hypothetical protein
MRADIVRQLGDAVARLLRPARSFRSAVRMARHSLARKRGPTAAEGEAEFLERLKTIIRRNAGAAQAGRINVIGLDRLKEQFGARWDELRDRVQSVARSALKKSLAPDDIWVASGDKFVIAFGSLSTDEAQTKCRMIARLIETALLGDAATETISVAAAVATVDGNIVFRDLPALETMLARSCTFYAGAPRHERDAGVPALAPMPHFSPARPRGRRGLEATEHAIAPRESVEIAAIEGKPPAADRVGWEPVWDTKTRRITLYRARHIDDVAALSTRLALDEAMVSDIDFELRDIVLDRLNTCRREARLVALALPVRFWTLASWSRRRDYIGALAERVSPELRNLLVVILSDVPDGVSPTRLVELVAALRPLCREIIVEGPSHGVDLAALAAARVFAVGSDLNGQNASEGLLLLKIEQFARSAEKAAIANTCLAGAHSMSLVTAAVGAGFRYISGRMIGDIEGNIGCACSLTLDDVYRRYIETEGLGWPDDREPLRQTA